MRAGRRCSLRVRTSVLVVEGRSDGARNASPTEGQGLVTSHPPAKDHLPVYDGLVRERGDVVAEVREVAERTLDQARRALAGDPGARRERAPR